MREKTQPLNLTETGFNACICEIVFWMNVRSGHSVWNAIVRIFLQEWCPYRICSQVTQTKPDFATWRCEPTNQCADLNDSSIPSYVKPTQLLSQSKRRNRWCAQTYFPHSALTAKCILLLSTSYKLYIKVTQALSSHHPPNPLWCCFSACTLM